MSHATPGTVTIRIPASRTAELRSPGRSMTDGSPHPVLVQTWAINYPFRPRRLTLAVDAAAARQVKRYNRTVAALLLTCMASVLVSGGYIVVAVLLATRLFPALLLLLLILILVAGLGVGVMVSGLRQRPRIYPGAGTRNEILIVGVNRGAAEEWRGANEPGVVTIVEPGR
jgi:hypothetical protein